MLFLNLTLIIFLGYSENENIPSWRWSIINELGQYLASTGRLISRVILYYTATKSLIFSSQFYNKRASPYWNGLEPIRCRQTLINSWLFSWKENLYRNEKKNIQIAEVNITCEENVKFLGVELD